MNVILVERTIEYMQDLSGISQYFHPFIFHVHKMMKCNSIWQ